MNNDGYDSGQQELNRPPYCVFEIHMDNLTDASIRLKIWQDKKFRDDKRIQASKVLQLESKLRMRKRNKSSVNLLGQDRHMQRIYSLYEKAQSPII